MPLLLSELVLRTTLSWGAGEGGGSGNCPIHVTHPPDSQESLRSPPRSLPLETRLTWTSFVSLPTSCPEDCCHEEEAATVHRALQVAPQLPEPLLRLLRAGVRRAHQPGTWGTREVGPEGTPEPWRPGLSRGSSASRQVDLLFLFNFLNNSKVAVGLTFVSPGKLLWPSGFYGKCSLTFPATASVLRPAGPERGGAALAVFAVDLNCPVLALVG